MEKYKNSKFIFIIGIGGSNLASKAIWNAINLHKKNEKRLFFLESPDIREYKEIEDFVKNQIFDLNDFVLVTISKSGKTEETLESFHRTFDILSEKFGQSINERVLIISSKNTPLWKIAEEKNIEKIEWPENIGGRFSAFSIPHTSVLSIVGINTNEFLRGSKEVNEKEAEILAEKIFEGYKENKNILDFFIFNTELEDLGKWSRQLIAESLGKKNNDGIETGIIPTVSIGPVDLHSMLQLYLGGEKNRFTIFLVSHKEISQTINEEIFENITKAYTQHNLPFMKYEIKEINEYELGQFMSFMIKTTIKLSELIGVNPYNQPEVENYKKIFS